MKNIITWIKTIFAAIAGVFFSIMLFTVVKKYYYVKKKQNIESPLPFIKDKKNINTIYVKKDNEWSEVRLPQTIDNQNVKAVQINNCKNVVEVKLKHETIDFSSYIGDGSSSLDL